MGSERRCMKTYQDDETNKYQEDEVVSRLAECGSFGLERFAIRP